MIGKILVFDVDNTVTESRQEISDEMARILNRIPSEIAFISGTLLPELKRMISSKLIRKHHLLPNTGTHYVIMEKNNEKEILKETLSSSQKEDIVTALKKLKEELGKIFGESPLLLHHDLLFDGMSLNPSNLNPCHISDTSLACRRRHQDPSDKCRKHLYRPGKLDLSVQEF